MRKNINLQLFTDGDNGNSPVRIYSKQFMGLMAAVFNVQAHFRDPASQRPQRHSP